MKLKLTPNHAMARHDILHIADTHSPFLRQKRKRTMEGSMEG